MKITIRMGALSFAPRLVTTAAAAALVALLLWLGSWQVDRAHEMQARQALFEARMHESALLLTGSVPSAEPLLYRRVRVAGTWMADHQIFIDNQVLEGRAGFIVVTPLKLEGKKDAVLVNRGWIARTADYPRPPPVGVPSGPVEVSGTATLPPRRFLELSNETVTGDVWQNLSLDRYRARTGLEILPVVVLEETHAPGLAAIREVPNAGAAKHEEYALTWFLLAATTLVLWIAMNLRKVA
ncbi:MAG: SURF1 family protein [Usitatibacter sp.]